MRYNAQKVGFFGGGGVQATCRIRWSSFKGQVWWTYISVTTKDGNDNIFLVTLAVVEQENKNSWVWFLQTFVDDIGRPNELNLVFISNLQKVIQFTYILRSLFVLSHYISAF